MNFFIKKKKIGFKRNKSAVVGVVERATRLWGYHSGKSGHISPFLPNDHSMCYQAVKKIENNLMIIHRRTPWVPSYGDYRWNETFVGSLCEFVMRSFFTMFAFLLTIFLSFFTKKKKQMINQHVTILWIKVIRETVMWNSTPHLHLILYP